MKMVRKTFTPPGLAPLETGSQSPDAYHGQKPAGAENKNKIMRVRSKNREIPTLPTATADLRSLTPYEQKSYRQSVYVVYIERFFGLCGLVCYAEEKHDGGYDFAFRHVATDERILVFSRLDDAVFEAHEKLTTKHRVIIDTCDTKISAIGGEDDLGQHNYALDACHKALQAGFFLMSDHDEFFVSRGGARFDLAGLVAMEFWTLEDCRKSCVNPLDKLNARTAEMADTTKLSFPPDFPMTA